MFLTHDFKDDILQNENDDSTFLNISTLMHQKKDKRDDFSKRIKFVTISISLTLSVFLFLPPSIFGFGNGSWVDELSFVILSFLLVSSMIYGFIKTEKYQEEINELKKSIEEKRRDKYDAMLYEKYGAKHLRKKHGYLDSDKYIAEVEFVDGRKGIMTHLSYDKENGMKAYFHFEAESLSDTVECQRQVESKPAIDIIENLKNIDKEEKEKTL